MCSSLSWLIFLVHHGRPLCQWLHSCFIPPSPLWLSLHRLPPQLSTNPGQGQPCPQVIPWISISGGNKPEALPFLSSHFYTVRNKHATLGSGPCWGCCNPSPKADRECVPHTFERGMQTNRLGKGKGVGTKVKFDENPQWSHCVLFCVFYFHQFVSLKPLFIWLWDCADYQLHHNDNPQSNWTIVQTFSAASNVPLLDYPAHIYFSAVTNWCSEQCSGHASF